MRRNTCFSPYLDVTLSTRITNHTHSRLPPSLSIPSLTIGERQSDKMFLFLILLLVFSEETAGSCLYDPAHGVCCDRGERVVRTDNTV